MPNIEVVISTASSAIPRMSMRLRARPDEDGMNLTVSAMSRMPIGTLTRKMPRHDQ